MQQRKHVRFEQGVSQFDVEDEESVAFYTCVCRVDTLVEALQVACKTEGAGGSSQSTAFDVAITEAIHKCGMKWPLPYDDKDIYAALGALAKAISAVAGFPARCGIW